MFRYIQIFGGKDIIVYSFELSITLYHLKNDNTLRYPKNVSFLGTVQKMKYKLCVLIYREYNFIIKVFNY